MAESSPVKAALVVIGNEILSGKVEESNSRYLAQEVFELGWDLIEIAVIADDSEKIVETLMRLSPQVDHLFTSGGIGPTHDDITLAAVARATGRQLVVSSVLETLLKHFYKVDILTPSQQRLAMIPEGSVLHYGEASQYPQMMVGNIYPLPGIPDLFRAKFQELKELWPVEKAFERRCFNLVAMETELAELLAEIAQTYPDVRLGSYPTHENDVWHLELVLESRNGRQLEEATRALSEALGVEPSQETVAT